VCGCVCAESVRSSLALAALSAISAVPYFLSLLCKLANSRVRKERRWVVRPAAALWHVERARADLWISRTDRQGGSAGRISRTDRQGGSAGRVGCRVRGSWAEGACVSVRVRVRVHVWPLLSGT
jgi:hypothetical protein